MAADRSVVVGVTATAEEPVEMALKCCVWRYLRPRSKALLGKLIVSQLRIIFPGNFRNSKIH